MIARSKACVRIVVFYADVADASILFITVPNLKADVFVLQAVCDAVVARPLPVLGVYHRACALVVVLGSYLLEAVVLPILRGRSLVLSEVHALVRVPATHDGMKLVVRVYTARDEHHREHKYCNPFHVKVN